MIQCRIARTRIAPPMLPLLLALAVSAPLPAAPVTWPLEYRDRSTNAFIWDERAAPLVEATVPAPLATRVLEGLGGPPDPVNEAGARYVSASECVPHACMVKGFYWIDTVTGAALGGHFLDGPGIGDNTLELGSRSFAADEIPPQAITAVRAWLTDVGARADAITFVDATGEAVALPWADFT